MFTITEMNNKVVVVKMNEVAVVEKKDEMANVGCFEVDLARWRLRSRRLSRRMYMSMRSLMWEENKNKLG